MGKKQRSCKEAGSRAWRVLRLALLWARKGGMLKSGGLISELRQGIMKHLKHDTKTIWYGGERQLSFDDTPIIRLKRNRHPGSRSASLRFLLPSCIQPDDVDFDFDFDGDDDDAGWCRKGYVENNAEDSYLEQCEEEEMVMMNAATDFFSMQTSSSTSS